MVYAADFKKFAEVNRWSSVKSMTFENVICHVVCAICDIWGNSMRMIHGNIYIRVVIRVSH